jgi:hypothetical protein
MHANEKEMCTQQADARLSRVFKRVAHVLPPAVEFEQSLVEYSARAPPQQAVASASMPVQPLPQGYPMPAQPLPQGYVQGPQGYVQGPNGMLEGQQQAYSPYAAPAQAAVPAPAPAPPPAFSNAFNSFLAQVPCSLPPPWFTCFCAHAWLGD